MLAGVIPEASPSAMIPPVEVPANIVIVPGRSCSNAGYAVSSRSSRTAVSTPRIPPPSQDRILKLAMALHLPKFRTKSKRNGGSWVNHNVAFLLLFVVDGSRADSTPGCAFDNLINKLSLLCRGARQPPGSLVTGWFHRLE